MKSAILSRRRFLTITATAAVLPMAAAATPVSQWHGVALGARTSITLAHPDAAQLVARARAEIERLEEIFSLYRPTSALARLNATGRLVDPPFELLECLSQCDIAYTVTNGAFDPSVQPLWALYARKAQAGAMPDEADLRAVLEQVGWRKVRTSTTNISFARPGMALTLNGIAQGYIADRVADLLKAEGVRDVLIDTGEIAALGARPDGAPWEVTLTKAQTRLPNPVALRDRALATSAPRGTLIGPDGAGHILDPISGKPAPSRWSLVSVTARSAAQADALSTAGCLMGQDAFEAAVQSVPGAAIARLL